MVAVEAVTSAAAVAAGSFGMCEYAYVYRMLGRLLSLRMLDMVAVEVAVE